MAPRESHNEKLSAWTEFSAYPIQGRSPKPRTNGLTMVIDKGLGLNETEDLLSLAGDYIDLVKISFGSSALYPPHVLRKKLDLIRAHGVDACPGGTLLEVALFQGILDRFLGWAADAGFTWLEVSDGTIEMGDDVRADCLRKAVGAGFKVVSEVGKKDAHHRLSPEETHRQMARDLAAGSFKVIVEARESGKGIGIFAADGSVKQDELELIVAGVSDPKVILWEAPLKNQQEALILRFGPDVNLGNIQTNEVIALESLRVGLRGDTFKTCLPKKEGKG
ncbi:MAG: phosphosulfolactate synthase [Bacillota bacterium]